MTMTPRTVAAVLLAFASAGAAHAADPVSRPLGGSPALSKAALKEQPRMPPPAMTVLTASLDAQGRVVVRCSESENPAFRAWRERVGRGGGQER